MAATGTGSLGFIDDVTADGSSTMNYAVFRAAPSAKNQPNASKMTEILLKKKQKILDKRYSSVTKSIT